MDWRRKANGARANSCLSFPLVKNCGPRRSSPPGDPASLFIEQFELLRLESLVEKIFPKRWRGGESKFNARPVKEPRFDAQWKLPLGQEGRKKGGHCYWNEIRRSKRWKNCGQNELWLGRKLCNAITGARSLWLAVSVLEHDRPQF